MRATNSRSYRIGYREGRSAGYAKGREVGMTDAQANRGQVSLADGPALAEGRVLIIPAATELPSLEILVAQPLRELQSQGLYDFTVKLEHEVTDGDLAQATHVIFIRNVEPGALTLLQRAKELGRKTIYVIDDHFLEIPPGTALHAYYSDPVRRHVFVQLLIHSAKIMVASAYFADHIRLYYNPNVVYFPASVDFTLFDAVPRIARNDETIIIGYEGTNKEADFIPVIPAIKQIMMEFGDRVKFVFHGFMPSGLQGYPQMSFSPMMGDYRLYMQQLYQNAWDIGLAPLSDHLFNRCKTNNKFREYAACLIPGVYSQSPVYQDWVVHGETGYAVPHTVEGWYEGLKQMVINPALRQKIRDQANAHARAHFSIQTCAGKWLNHLLRV